MNSEQFVFNIDELFEQFDMTQVLAKARKADYRKVFQEEKYSTKNAGVIDGLEKPIDEVKHPVDWVIKDYNESTMQEDRDWFVHTSTWAVAEAVTDGVDDETMKVAKYFSDILDMSIDYLQPRFLRQVKGEELRYHTDGVVNCGINFLLQGGQTPVHFQDYPEPIQYKAGVFNTQALHMVPPLPTLGDDRLLFKMKVPRSGPTYSQVVDKIKQFI
jgi:hypothetical protein